MKIRSRRNQQLKEHFFANLEVRITQRQAQGKPVLRLDMGSPDLPPADHILLALHSSADQPDHHSYQSLRGSPALRQAWASHYQHHYGVTLDPQTQVLPLIGSKEGIFLITQAVVDPQDVVLVPDPGYLTYAQAARFALAEPVYVPLQPELGWLPDLEAIPLAVLKRARLLWLNYPNNPTSAVASLRFFTSAVDFARQHDLLLCHDAAYSLVTFNGSQPLSLLQVPGASEVTVEFNTLSKAYNMAGWRVGAALGNPQAIESLYSVLTGVNSGSFRPVNEAAIAALTGDQSWIEGRNRVYLQRRDRVLHTLSDLGWQAAVPQAGLYIWFKVPSARLTSSEFCLALLEQTGVSLTPGSVFGQAGEGYVRLSLTSPDSDLELALDRMGKYQE